ncbi:MAG: right-handed parallel beta-helix repeat-containing protein [Thermoplasmatota archaeon]
MERPENGSSIIQIVFVFIMLATVGIIPMVPTGEVEGAHLPTRGVITVGWGGADFNTISAAVAAANNGDEIMVDAGVFATSVRIDKKLTITGNGTEYTRIVPDDKFNYTIMIDSDDVTIRGIHFDDQVQSIYSMVHINNTYSPNGVLIDDCEFTNMSHSAISTWGSEGITIRDSHFHDGHIGVDIIESSNNVVEGCLFERIDYIGVGMFNNDGETIVRNSEFRGDDWDRQVGVETHNTYDVLMKNLVISNMSSGIRIDRTSYNITITGCTISDSEMGIEASPPYTPPSNGLVIYDNTITRNNISMEFKDQNNVKIWYNTVKDNYGQGIYLYNDNDVVSVLYNNFINNHANPKQAFDNEGEANLYNSTTIGNHWSDHTSPDNDSDGVVDLSYNISTYAIDHRPKVAPFKPYAAPRIVTTPIRQWSVGIPYSVQYDVTDDVPWRNDLEWTMRSIPAGPTFTDDQVLKGNFSSDDPSKYNITITVTDGINSWTQKFDLQVIGGSTGPMITTDDVTTASVGILYRVDYDAIGSGRLTWYHHTNSSFLSMDATNGVLSGTPTANDVGSYFVLVEVNDTTGIDIHNFTLVVRAQTNPADDDVDIKEDDIIITDANELEYDRRKRVTFSGDSENITISWYIEGRGLVGSGTSILLDLPSGTYNLTMSAKDAGGHYHNVSTVLVVEGSNVSDPDTNWDIVIAGTLVTVVLLILLISIFIYRRRYRSEVSPGMGRTPTPKKPVPSRPPIEPALTFDGAGSVRSGSIDDMSIETSNIDEDIYPGREPDLEDILEIATSMSRFTDFVASKREMVKKARKGYVDGSIPRDIYVEVKRLLEE